MLTIWTSIPDQTSGGIDIMYHKFCRWFDTLSSRAQMTVTAVGIFALCYLVFGIIAGAFW